MSFMRFWRRPGLEQESESLHARLQAEVALERAKEQRPAVEALSQSLRASRSENHYADRIATMILHGRA